MNCVYWTKRAGTILLLSTTLATGLTGGCQRPAEAHPAKVADAPVSAPATMDSAKPAAAPAPPVDYADKGAHMQYPRSWTPKKDDDFDLHLVPAAGNSNCAITFDVPDLPPHFPGMIRLGLIENGYLDDLKKKHAGLHVDSSADHALPDGACKARLVQSSWKENGTSHSDVGLLMMRKDVVYILSCNADVKDIPATRADFDKMVTTLHWDK